GSRDAVVDEAVLGLDVTRLTRLARRAAGRLAIRIVIAGPIPADRAVPLLGDSASALVRLLGERCRRIGAAIRRMAEPGRTIAVSNARKGVVSTAADARRVAIVRLLLGRSAASARRTIALEAAGAARAFRRDGAGAAVA